MPKSDKKEKILKTIEEWRAEKFPVIYFMGADGKPLRNTWTDEPRVDFYKDKSWLYEAAKKLAKWATNEAVTEEEFDIALDKAANYYIREER